MNAGRVFTSGFQGRLASDNRKSRESSCFSNSLKVKRVGKNPIEFTLNLIYQSSYSLNEWVTNFGK